MEIISSIIGVIGVALGWTLSQFGDYFNERKADRKKLKRLLFYLLELRYQLQRDLNLEVHLKECFNSVRNKLQEITGEPMSEDSMESILIQQIKSQYDQSSNILSLENEIDNIIAELSEIYPVFAYELKGKYNIKNRFTIAKENLEPIIVEAPIELKNVVADTLSIKNLIAELDEYIKEIAKKISKKTKKDVIQKIKNQDYFDIGSINEFADEFFVKLNSEIEKGLNNDSANNL